MQQTAQECALGSLTYTLTRKRVKNINLRVRRDGSVAVSAPLRCPQGRIDAFLQEKLPWICAAQAKAKAAEPQYLVPCSISPQDALALFTQVSDEIFPLFADLLRGQRPILKVRNMKTRWGVCKVSARQITFALRLAEKPRAAIEYVVLHEYAHFAVPNHSAAFWAVVARYMPDYKLRKALLRDAP